MELKKTAFSLGALAFLFAVLRFFLKGWLEPQGVPVFIGSFLASVSVVLLIAIGIFFFREGRAEQGKYVRGAVWYLALAAWCEILVIAGIFVTERSGADTYYIGPWQRVIEKFPTAREHAIGHLQGFFFRAAVGLIIGAAVYLISRRGRSPGIRA